MNQIAIDTKCPHERDGIPTHRTVKDYAPLTENQVRALLTQAATADCRTQNSIQIRLIRGMTCPRPASNAAMAVMESEYVDTLKVAPESLPALAGRFYRLMHKG